MAIVFSFALNYSCIFTYTWLEPLVQTHWIDLLHVKKRELSHTQFRKSIILSSNLHFWIAATFISMCLLLKKSGIKKSQSEPLIMQLKTKKHPYGNSLLCPAGCKVLTTAQLLKVFPRQEPTSLWSTSPASLASRDIKEPGMYAMMMSTAWLESYVYIYRPTVIKKKIMHMLPCAHLLWFHIFAAVLAYENIQPHIEGWLLFFFFFLDGQMNQNLTNCQFKIF